MTRAEELVYAAAFAQAIAAGHLAWAAAEVAHDAVLALRSVSAGPEHGRNAWQRMLVKFRGR